MNTQSQWLILGARASGDFVALDGEERRRHLYIVGQTGTGKSTLLVNLLRQDFESGAGLIEDPDYALAMSGLSDTYSLLSWYGDLPPADAIPKAIAPAKRAVQLDPQLAEAHTSLGFCQLCNWDRAGAEREIPSRHCAKPAYDPCALLARVALLLRWAPRRGHQTVPAGSRARAFFGN